MVLAWLFLDSITHKSRPRGARFRHYRGDRVVIFVTLCNAVDAFLKSGMRRTNNGAGKLTL